MKKTVKIYTVPTCHYCAQAKEYFTEKGIEFQAFDVTSDAEAMKEMRTITGGARSVPVIAIADQVIVGFDRDAVEKALKSDA
jgi:alkyl hydroperoxide reductase subunit F